MTVTIYQHANCNKCDSGFCEHAERVMARRKREEIIADERELGDGEPSALLGICERGNHAPLYGSKKHRQPHSRLADCENWCEVPQKPSDYVTTRGPMINAGRVPAYSESGAAQEVSPPSPVEEWRVKYYLNHRMTTVAIDGELFECQMLEAYARFRGGDTRELKAATRPKMMWGWDIEEIKSALRMFQSKHPGKSPLEVERLLGEPA